MITPAKKHTMEREKAASFDQPAPSKDDVDLRKISAKDTNTMTPAENPSDMASVLHEAKLTSLGTYTTPAPKPVAAPAAITKAKATPTFSEEFADDMVASYGVCFGCSKNV